jgi:hypothetical protein
MEPEEKKIVAAVPESITINGVTYSVRETPELQSFVQAVAKVEKSKLYSQFESLKSQFNTLSKVKIEAPNAPLDVNQFKQEMMNEITASLLPQIKEVVTEIVQPVLAATEKTAKTELDTYRERLINENLAVCIPDLVTGNSKEEIDASLQRSISIRASYPSANALPVNGKVVDPLIVTQQAALDSTAPAPQRPTVPRVPGIPAPEVSNPPTPKAMSMDEFAKNRDQLFRQMQETLGE